MSVSSLLLELELEPEEVLGRVVVEGRTRTRTRPVPSAALVASKEMSSAPSPSASTSGSSEVVNSSFFQARRGASMSIEDEDADADGDEEEEEDGAFSISSLSALRAALPAQSNSHSRSEDVEGRTALVSHAAAEGWKGR